MSLINDKTNLFQDVKIVVLIPLRKESKYFANSADYDQDHVGRCLI